MLSRFFQDFLCQRIAARCGTTHGFCSDSRNFTACYFQYPGTLSAAVAQEVASTFRDCSPGGIHLDAAALATAAERTTKINGHVATFTCAARSPLVNLALQNQRRADTGSQAHIENTVVSLACAPPGFRQSRCVCIIG